MLLELKMRILRTFGYQYKAAQAIGIRDDELSAFLRGRKQLSKEQLNKLYTGLKLSPSELLEINETITQIFEGVGHE